MPAADPPSRSGGRVRRFVGRYETLVIVASGALVGGTLLAIWHRWEVELLERRWFQAILLLAFCAVLVPVLFWGEGGLPPAGGNPGRRRPRGERERRRGRGRPRRRR